MGGKYKLTKMGNITKNGIPLTLDSVIKELLQLEKDNADLIRKNSHLEKILNRWAQRSSDLSEMIDELIG